MDDITDRLRRFAKLWLSIKTNCETIHGINDVELTTDDLADAAAEIEQLRSQLAARDRDIADWLREQGIDKDESEDGWWVTSTGCEFGARIAAKIERGDYRREKGDE